MTFTRSQILSRYRQVTRTLSRHGLGFLAEHLGLARLRFWRWSAAPAPGGRGQRLRRAFEELGPAFVKLGQVLSTRSDLLPPDVLTALERLQDQVAPFPYDQVRELLERELGAPPEQLFRSFDPEPIAAASLGQVHKAVLQTGEEVVVKLQRPGVEEIIDLDLHVLQGLAAAAARRRSRHVTPAQWQEIVAHMRDEFRAGRYEEGLKQAVDEVTALLVKHFPAASDAPNANELPDHPVLG